MKSNALLKGLSKTKFVVFCGLMIAVSLVIKFIFEIYIPLGGLPTLRLNLTSVPIYLSGILLGPAAGFAVGFLSDLLCWVLKPAGPLIIGISFSYGLVGLLPCFIMAAVKKFKIKHYFVFNVIFVIFSCVVFFFTKCFTFANGGVQFDGETVDVIWMVILGVLMAGFIVLPMIIFKYNQKKTETKPALLPADECFFIVSVTQLITSVIITSLCLASFYGQAIMVLLPGRLISNFFLIPLYTVCIVGLLKIIPKKYR